MEEQPEGWPAWMPASFSSGQEALSKNPVIPPRTLRAEPAKRVLGVHVSLGYFSFERKVTRPLASGRNARRAGEQPGVMAQLTAQPKNKGTGLQLSLE
jgi:hypothetical protein